MRKGDKIICIHDIDNIYDKTYGSIVDGVILDGTDRIGKVPLTIGKSYTLLYDSNAKFCCITNDEDEILWYDIKLFITMSEYREQQLNKIIK